MKIRVQLTEKRKKKIILPVMKFLRSKIIQDIMLSFWVKLMNMIS